MPGYKGHIVGGLVTSSVVVGYCIVQTGAVVELSLEGLKPTAVMKSLDLVAVFLMGLLGALFPDSDTDSKGQNLFYSLFVLVDLGLIYQKSYQLAAWLGLFAMLPALGHHRGWTHSWLAMILVGSPIVLIPMLVLGDTNWQLFLPYYVSFTCGYCSHLVLDKLI